MKFKNSLNAERYPNSVLVESLALEASLPTVEGEMEVAPCEFRSDRVSLIFNGTLRGRTAIYLAWTLHEAVFRMPILSRALIMVISRFLSSIVQVEMRSGSPWETSGFPPSELPIPPFDFSESAGQHLPVVNLLPALRNSTAEN